MCLHDVIGAVNTHTHTLLKLRPLCRELQLICI